MNSRAHQIYANVLEAMQEADEIEGVEGEDYLTLMDHIRHTATLRYNNCADGMKEIDEEKYFENMDARKNAFWQGRNDFYPVKECRICNGDSEEEYYVCIDHTKEQLEQKGY